MAEVPLAHHCQVLVLLHESNRPLDCYEINDQLKSLTRTQVNNAIAHLVRSCKVNKLRKPEGAEKGVNGNVRYEYTFNESYDQENKVMCDLGVQPARVSQRAREVMPNKNPYTKNLELKKKRLFVNCKFRQQKIKLLVKLLNKYGGNEKELLHSMINDYNT